MKYKQITNKHLKKTNLQKYIILIQYLKKRRKENHKTNLSANEMHIISKREKTQTREKVKEMKKQPFVIFS